MHPKILVTSICPTCQKEWEREEYVGQPIALMALTVCNECDTGEEVTIVGNSKVWGEAGPFDDDECDDDEEEPIVVFDINDPKYKRLN